MTARSLAAMTLALLSTAPVLAGQPPSAPGPTAASAPARPQGSGSSAPADDARVKTATKGTPTAPAESVAEQINRLQNTIESEEKHLERLKAERDDPAGEYAQAKAAFEGADESLQARKKALEALPPGDLAGRRDIGAQVAELEKLRNLAKDQFDLAIEERKAIGQQVANLEQMLVRDRKELDRLQSVAPTPAATSPAPTGSDPSTALATPPANGTMPAAPAAGTPGAAVLTTPATATAATTPPPAATAPPAATLANGAAALGTPAAAATPTPASPADPPSEELVAAQRDAETKVAASREADAEARTATDRLQSLDKGIALEKELLQTARKQRDNAEEIRRDLNESFRTRSVAGAPRAELDGLLAQVRKIEERHKAASDEVHEHSVRLEELQSERAGLQADQLAALKKAEEARSQAKVAEEEIQRIENPFRPRNILIWMIDHGPKMLAVLLAMLVAHWLSKHFCERVIWLIAHKGARGTGVEREDRARTLVGVFYNAASVTIFLGGGLMVLQEAGIPIAPLLGGAAVFGLAVAFGAQNLIRDYFYGFVILLENQYKLNDVVKIGELSGQVEQITLRMTVLRDLEGCVHFIPNGQVTAVTNMTHGWSRALFGIGVAYKEDVDRVMAVLAALAHDLRNDPQFGPLILEDVTMLGVDELADSAVIIKFFIKTRPLQQWTIRRELLRRIKNRFDELGIEIPFPHRTVFHRSDDGTAVVATNGAPPRLVYGGQ